MGHERQPLERLPSTGYLRSAETVVATRKKSWRLDGHKLDRQRDWLGVSKTQSSSTGRWMRAAALTIGLRRVDDRSSAGQDRV
jgi:hypothetical protein